MTSFEKTKERIDFNVRRMLVGVHSLSIAQAIIDTEIRPLVKALEDIKKHQENVMRSDFEMSATWILATRALKSLGYLNGGDKCES